MRSLGLSPEVLAVFAFLAMVVSFGLRAFTLRRRFTVRTLAYAGSFAQVRMPFAAAFRNG